MSQLNRTAVTIIKLEDRLPLFLQFRRASLNPTLTMQRQMTYRLAGRFVRGNVDSPLYDQIARLQILEGVSGIVTLQPMVSGPWSKNPRQGLKAALDFFAGTNIDPEWFSLGNTGLISRVREMIRREFNKWTRGREVHFNPDDILQNGLMGLRKDGVSLLKHGPVMIQFGNKSIGIRQAIPDGRVTPADVAGVVAKFFTQKVQDQFKKIDRSRAPSEDDEGRSILDQQSMSPRDMEDTLADAISDPHNPIRKMIFQALERRLGEGKWAELGLVFLTAQANGETINQTQFAAQYGMSSGTMTKILRERINPALDKIRADHRIQDALESYAERRRFARLQHLRSLRA